MGGHRAAVGGAPANTWRAKQARAAGKMSLLEQKIEHIEITGAWAGRWFLFLIIVYLKVSKNVLEMFQCRKFERSRSCGRS